MLVAVFITFTPVVVPTYRSVPEGLRSKLDWGWPDSMVLTTEMNGTFAELTVLDPESVNITFACTVLPADAAGTSHTKVFEVDETPV